MTRRSMLIYSVCCLVGASLLAVTLEASPSSRIRVLGADEMRATFGDSGDYACLNIYTCDTCFDCQCTGGIECEDPGPVTRCCYTCEVDHGDCVDITYSEDDESYNWPCMGDQYEYFSDKELVVIQSEDGCLWNETCTGGTWEYSDYAGSCAIPLVQAEVFCDSQDCIEPVE